MLEQLSSGRRALAQGPSPNIRGCFGETALPRDVSRLALRNLIAWTRRFGGASEGTRGPAKDPSGVRAACCR
ncbi:hypothetical protein QEH58_20955, partial [Roseibacillus persicicus]|nr:hypothetical protein [Roseibacillus persicicus]